MIIRLSDITEYQAVPYVNDPFWYYLSVHFKTDFNSRFIIDLLLLFILKTEFLKDSDAGRDWGQEEKGTTEDEMAGWHHWLDGHESGRTLGVGDGQGGLACCDSWGCKESDMTERLNWTELNWICAIIMSSIL